MVSNIVGIEGLIHGFRLAINMKMSEHNNVSIASESRVSAGVVIILSVSSRSPHDTLESKGFLFPIHVQPWMVGHLPGTSTFTHIKREHWLQETAQCICFCRLK